MLPLGAISGRPAPAASSAAGFGRSLAGAAVSMAGNIGSTLINYNLQKKLLKNQYDEFFNAARRAGASPAAVAQGLTGSGSASTPSVSNGSPMPDIASNANVAQDVQSGVVRRGVENQLDLMRLVYEPKKFQADIAKAFSEVNLNYYNGQHFKSLASLNREIEHNYRMMRPWQIAQMSAGLRNSLAEFQRINAETNKIKAEEGYFKSASSNQDSQAYRNWNEGYNASLQSFGIMFDNNLRASGINPNLAPWDALKQLAMSDPKAFEGVMNNLIDVTGRIDDRMKFSLGEHYKRNIMLGAGLVGGYKFLNGRKDKKLQRLESMTRIIGNIVPFANPSMPMMYPSMGSISPFPYYSNF